MLQDALLDLTNRGDAVLDPFLGSGSTLIAAEKTGRVCRGVELDPLYVDVIVRRYEVVTGKDAALVETGETFAALAARRAREEGERRKAADATSGTPDAAGDAVEAASGH
jgi:DNA modification methylase